MRIVLSIDASNGWAAPARWVLEQMLEVLGFDTCTDPPPRGTFVTVRYGVAEGAPPAGRAEVRIPAEKGAPPSSYEPDLGFLNAKPPPETTSRADRSAGVVEHVGFDLVAPAWFFLARAEEEGGERDELGRFRPEGSWQINRRVHQMAIVDLLGYWLLGAINRAAARAGIAGMRKLPWPEGRTYALALTHDQDQSVRWKRRIARQLIGIARGGAGGRGAAWRRLRRFLSEGAVAETVFSERVLDWEEGTGIRSTFFFLPVRRDRFGRRYDVNAPSFRALFRRLADGGHGVALHASLDAATSAEMLRGERELISRAAGREVSGIRHHYLRLDFPHTWRLHEEAGFRWDASLGFPDHPGFRGGTAFPFRPPGTSHFVAFPLTGMDRALVAAGLTSEEKWEEWSEPTRRMGGLLDILWHPYFIDPEAGADREALFRTLLSWIASQAGAAWITTLDEAADWWDRRRALRVVETTSGDGRTTVRYRCGAPVGAVALSPVPAATDIRIESGAPGGKVRLGGETMQPAAIAGSMRAGDELTVSLGHRNWEGEP